MRSDSPAVDTEPEDRLNSCPEETLVLLGTYCDPAFLALIMSVRWDVSIDQARQTVETASAIKAQQ
jgi:hypothetical protein